MPRSILAVFVVCLVGCSGTGRAASEKATVADLPPGATAVEQAGREVFIANCTKCHLEGLGDAPVVLSREAWAARAAQPRETLYQHAIEGFWGDVGEMPARGDQELTDEQVQRAVDYIVSIQTP